MRKLWVLLKLNFRAMLRAFSFRSGAGSSKKKAAGGLGALLLMAFLALYLSGVYSFLLASMLAEVGIVEMVLPLMALMACVMSLMFTLFAASGLVFGGKDSDIVLALPVPAFTVMLSKILALYLENLVFCGLWMLPTGAAYLVYAGLGAGPAAGGMDDCDRQHRRSLRPGAGFPGGPGNGRTAERDEPNGLRALPQRL